MLIRVKAFGLNRSEMFTRQGHSPNVKFPRILGIEAVGLVEQGRQRPNQLSGGQKQRVAIARALVKDPEFVLADEPTANLDSHTGASIIELMRRMQEQFATTFVFSTHDRQLMSHADETFTIRDGVLVDHVTGATSC